MTGATPRSSEASSGETAREPAQFRRGQAALGGYGRPGAYLAGLPTLLDWTG